MKLLPLQTVFRISLFALLVFSVIGLYSQDIEEIGGPYDVDENTRLYLRFEGDFTNESDLADDAETHGNVIIFGESSRPEVGQSAYLNNDATTDSSFIMVPHSEHLNLYDDWTIEMWFMIQTFGTSAEDHRWVPVLMWKRGDTTFDQGNYFMEIWGNTRHLSTGFSVAGHGWPQVNSPQNTIQAGQWYHVTFIRDSEHAIMVQMIHDDEKNLVWSGTYAYDPETQHTPNITEQPLYIGTNADHLAVQPGFMDGFVDEIRISDVVRNFAVPPVIRSVSQVNNIINSSNGDITVEAEVIKVGGSDLQDVTLHYNNGNDWESTAMVYDDTTYIATIPEPSTFTVVQYYVTAENDAGLASNYPGGALDENFPEYLTFTVLEPESQTLFLDFEEGQLPVEDKSDYNNPVYVYGEPTFSTDAADGDYAILLNGVTDFLQVPSSAVSFAEEFTLDFWMNANSLEGDWRFIVNKPAISPGFWGENSYEIISQPTRRLTGGVFSFDEAGGWVNTRITLDPEIEFEKWYRIILEVRKAPEGDSYNYYLFFQINDENDEVLAKNHVGFHHPVAWTNYPMRIGKAGGDRPYFDGMFDNVKFFNYARGEITVDAPPNITAVTDIGNVTDDVAEPYDVQVDVNRGLGGDISEVKLHYYDGNEWNEVQMAEVQAGVYNAAIPPQPLHTIVRYYVSAVNVDGNRALYPENAESDSNPDWLIFAVEEHNTEVLHMTFEEGEGVPVDNSLYSTYVNVHGAPVYVQDSNTGTYSLSFNGESDYIEVFSPLIGSSEEFTLEFKMKANSLDGFWRFLLNKPAIVPPFWGENTVEIITGAFDDPDPRITAGVWSHEEGNTRITLPPVLEMGKWYHVVFEVQVADDNSDFNYYAVVQLNDENNNLLAQDYKGFNHPVSQSRYPFRIGKAGGDRPYYDGLFDDIFFYNYSHVGLDIITSVDDNVEQSLPKQYQLSQNFPNPFNPVTTIEYSIPESGMVSIKVYNILGQEVRTLVNEDQSAGSYRVTFNATDLPSGLYFYSISINNFIETKKMIYLK